LFGVVLALLPLAAWPDIYQPAAGTPERAAIMDAARVPICDAIGLPVIFLVSVLQSDRRYAYFQAIPQNSDGTAINWKVTLLAEYWAQGIKSDTAMVLAERQGKGWMVLDWVMGPTDVYWIGRMNDYRLPERFFRGD